MSLRTWVEGLQTWQIAAGAPVLAFGLIAAEFAGINLLGGPWHLGSPPANAPLFSQPPAVTPIPVRTHWPPPLRASTIPPSWATPEQAPQPPPTRHHGRHGHHGHHPTPPPVAPTPAPPTATPTVTVTPTDTVTPTPTVTITVTPTAGGSPT